MGRTFGIKDNGFIYPVIVRSITGLSNRKRFEIQAKQKMKIINGYGEETALMAASI